MLAVGDMAPEFSLHDQAGKRVTVIWPWPDETVKAIVLFFYPKADTSGCTVEACSFRDARADFDAANAIVLGISPDPVKAQQKFADKFGLPMQLLADAERSAVESYGVWVQKSMYGRSYMGVSRETFIIGPDGRTRHIFRKVKPAGHAEEVLTTLKGLGL